MSSFFCLFSMYFGIFLFCHICQFFIVCTLVVIPQYYLFPGISLNPPSLFIVIVDILGPGGQKASSSFTKEASRRGEWKSPVG